MTDAEVAWQRGQETALRLSRERAERRGEPAPVHARRRLAKGEATKTVTARLRLDVYLHLARLCAESHREMNIVLNEIVQQSAAASRASLGGSAG